MLPYFPVANLQDKLFGYSELLAYFCKRCSVSSSVISDGYNIFISKLAVGIEGAFAGTIQTQPSWTSKIFPNRISAAGARCPLYSGLVVICTKTLAPLRFSTLSANSCSFVKFLMISSVRQLKIAKSIVRFNFVLMVNQFRAGKPSAKMIRHYQSMLQAPAGAIRLNMPSGFYPYIALRGFHC